MDDKEEERLLTGLGKGVTDMSLKSYRARLDQFKTATSKALGPSLLNVADSYKKLQKAYPNTVTRKTIVTSIVSVFKHNPDFEALHKKQASEWRVRQRHLSEMEQAIRDNNVVTDAMRAKLPDIAAVSEIAEKLKVDPPGLDSKKKSMQHLLLRMMVDMPPKRSDLGSVKVCGAATPVPEHGRNAKRPNVDGNFVVVHRTGPITLVLQDYKTSKFYGTFVERLPDGISKDVRESLKKYPRQHVFEDKDGKPYDGHAFGEYVKRTFKEYTNKPSGINAIRHAYIIATTKGKTKAERRKIATSMNHSLNQQYDYDLIGGARRKI